MEASEFVLDVIRDAPAGALGPVSARLERELAGEVKRSGIVVWLDLDDHYSAFAERLARRSARGDFPYPVVRYQGSFFEVLLALEGHGNELYPDKVLIHLPGFNETSVAETPIYELYKAGKRYRKSLKTLIEEAAAGVVVPSLTTAYLARESTTLQGADDWLVGARATGEDAFALALDACSVESVLFDLFGSEPSLRERLKDPENESGSQGEGERARMQLAEYLERQLGLPTGDWLALLAMKGRAPAAEDFPHFALSWLMGVEFVLDLKEPPLTPALGAALNLTKPLQQICLRLVVLLRKQFPEVYRAHSAEFEERLTADQNHEPAALGSIDTFQFEEKAVREDALSALTKGAWGSALEYARTRHPESCFWVERDKRLARTWRLLTLAAELGTAIAGDKQGLRGCASLEEATYRYRDGLFRVDQAQRAFEQAYHSLFSSELPDEAQLRAVRDAMRSAYRVWADRLAGEFAALCEKLGPLPAPDLRQRAVYESFVHPRIEAGERVAFFLVDALRFELADELRRVFEDKKFTATLHARLAELPTVTEVGMNALAPVAQAGRLRPVIKDRAFLGMRSGDAFTVHDPATRVRAMASRSVGGLAIDFELAEVVGAAPELLRKKLRSKDASPLLVVRSLEFDAAGEKGFHLGTFEHTLQQVREAVLRLHAAGISRFVLAADHGFLLQDQTARLIEYKDSPKRRHVLSNQPSGMADVLEVPLSALDYEVEGEAYLVLRRDTAIWKTQEKIAPFVHGGNSLQERVIPVLVLEKRAKAGSSTTRYEVVAKALPAELGRQRLSLHLRLQSQSTGMLSFAGPKRISLALRVPGDGITPEVVEVTPPGSLEGGVLSLPPGGDPVTVTFTLEGEVDDKVQVEVYHPDGTEQVTPKIVEGWFEVRENRRLLRSAPESARSPSSRPPASERTAARPAEDSWHAAFEDKDFLRVFILIESQESVSETELLSVLGSARRVRTFSRRVDDLKGLVPFEVEISLAGSIKCYVKGGAR